MDINPQLIIADLGRQVGDLSINLAAQRAAGQQLTQELAEMTGQRDLLQRALEDAGGELRRLEDDAEERERDSDRELSEPDGA